MHETCRESAGSPINPDSSNNQLQGRDIICFSHDWGGDPLSRNHIMRILSRDNRVLWVNSIGYRTPKFSRRDGSRIIKKLTSSRQAIHMAEENIYVFNPLAVPAYRSRWIRALNRRWLRRQLLGAMREIGFCRPISWIANPAAALLAGELGETAIVYHCVDDYASFQGVPSDVLRDLEAGLVRRANLVIVSSERLLEKKRELNPRTVLVRHGVDHEHFRRAMDDKTAVPEEISRLPKPTLGFIGLVADWVDTELLEHVASRFRNASLVLVGRVATDVDRLRRMSNVHFFGQRPYASLPGYCKAFDVALLPFRMDELTKHANPLKLREYVAAGLPVVSTDIPEAWHVPHCAVAKDRGEFIDLIAVALKNGVPRRLRSDAVRLEDWETKVENINQQLASHSILK